MDNHSTKPLTPSERTSNPFSGFIIWLSASSSISILPLGIFILQAYKNINYLLVVLIGSISFIIIGLISILGFNTGLPTMGISEKLFGKIVNRFISLLNWFAQVGWESISVILIVYQLRAIMYILLPRIPMDLFLAFLMSVAAAFAVPYIGYSAIVKWQKLVLSITVSISAMIILSMFNFSCAKSVEPAPMSSYIGAVSISLIGGVFSWTMFCADYARFVKPSYPIRRLISWSSMGGMLGNATLMLLAYTLYKENAIHFSSNGSIIFSEAHLSFYLYLSLLVFSVLSLLIANFLTSYSSAFSVSNFMRKDYDRSNLVILDAVIAALISAAIIFRYRDFQSYFISFLSLAVLISAPWTGVVLFRAIEEVANLRRRIPNTIKTNIYGLISGFVIEALLYFYYIYSNNDLFYNLIPMLGFFIPIFFLVITSVFGTHSPSRDINLEVYK